MAVQQGVDSASGEITTHGFPSRLRAERARVVFRDAEHVCDRCVIELHRCQNRDLIAQPAEEKSPTIFSRAKTWAVIRFSGEGWFHFHEHRRFLTLLWVLVV
jgi:hypothetical protein